MKDLTTMNSKATKLLKQLISCPSCSKEESGTAAIIEDYFSVRNINSKRHLNNIWVCNQHYDPAKETILLNSHHDTVKPNFSYTINPFEPIEKDGKIYGLGSNDAGASLVSLLATFLHFYERPDLKYNLIFAASAEEEISGANGIESLLPNLGKIAFAIVGEPTLLQAAIAEKGLMVLDCTIIGKAGHAAREEGENAIYKALQTIQWFKNFRFEKVSEMLGPVKMSVTKIDAGTQHNIIPDQCHFTVDVRVNECYTLEEILAIIRQNIACEIVPRSLRLRSTHIAADHPLVKAAVANGCETFGSATLSDKALMPFPALKIGPGDSARSHTADEFIYGMEIKKGIETYTNLLKQLL